MAMLRQELCEQQVDLVHAVGGEAWSYFAVYINGYERVIIESVQIPRHPVAPLGNVHAPNLALPDELPKVDRLDLVEGDSLAKSEREVVAFDDHMLTRNLHVLVLEYHYIPIVWHYYYY